MIQMTTKKDDFSWIWPLVIVGGVLWLLSRVNAPDATTTSPTSTTSSSESEMEAPDDQGSPGAMPDGLFQTHPEFLGPPIRVDGEKYLLGDTITIGPKDSLPLPPPGTQWWAPLTGANPLFVTYTLEVEGTYHQLVNPRDFV